MFTWQISANTPKLGGGLHCRWGPLNLGEESILPCSAVTPAAFGWSCLINTRTQHRPGPLISIPRVTAPEMYGTSGLRGFSQASCMHIGWMVRISQRKDIGSISTSCCWIRLRQRFRGHPIGISRRPADTIGRRWGRNETRQVPLWTMPLL
jgi:hypothetical protein